MSQADANSGGSKVSIPAFRGPAPINYDELRESVALVLASEGVGQETIQTVIQTVDDAVVQNEHQLQWGDNGSSVSESAVGTGGCPMTNISLENVPQEAVDYAFDQIGEGGLDILLRDYVDWGVAGELSLDYGSQTVKLTSLTVVEQAVRKAVDEKLAGMQYEIEHGERDDYEIADIRHARHALQFDISRSRV